MSFSYNHRPLVSVILPVYNEATHIEHVAQSILSQSHPDFDLEILVIDGNSTDGTSGALKSIAGSNPGVTLLSNPRRMTPAAFNIGLKHARGEYVCIFGAHTLYDPDYICTCLSELKVHDAIGCGGRVFTTAANASLQARLVAASLGTPFGTSSKSFRNHAEGYADTVNYPVYVRSALMDVGGYDEQMYRNQDNDLNQRLRARGYRLYMTWKTGCRYFVQPTILSLSKYAWKTGYWNLITVKKNASAHGIYQFVPGVFVLACLATSLLALSGLYVCAPYRGWASFPLLLLMGTYFGVALLVSGRVAARQRWFGALLLPLFFFSLHSSYGLGTFWALLFNAQSPETGRACSVLRQTKAR